MFTRELDMSEWPAFFDGFSRHYRGRPVTLDLPDALGASETIARGLPLVGITAERSGRRVDVASIEIVLGTGTEDHFVHTVHHPTRVLIGQITEGTDDTMVIRSSTDPTVRLDFRAPPRAARPESLSVESLEQPWTAW